MTDRVVRGGSFLSSARFVRCAVRYGGVPGNRRDNYGFRVVEEAPVDEAQESTDRVVRGGSFYNNARLVRCAVRYWFGPGNRNDNYGFRVVEDQGR